MDPGSLEVHFIDQENVMTKNEPKKNEQLTADATDTSKKTKKKIVLKDLENVVGGAASGALAERTSWTNGCN